MFRVARRRWRRSLQIRVVAATLLLGLIVVAVLGTLLLNRISSGLVASRRTTALVEAARVTRQAQEIFNATTTTDELSVDQSIRDTISQLQGPVNEQTRAVVLLQAERSRQPKTYIEAASPGIGLADIPASLRQAVNRAARQQSQLIPLGTGSGSDARTVPAIAVGAIVTIPQAGPYELYLVYRLDREQEILNLVRQAFVAGGFALVLLVGGVAFVVTRQVVTPVRQAVRTAEELASGHLDRRMRVRGEDDLARLGRAFNEMAAGLEQQIHRLEELSRVQRRFVSDVSHELRTPLTTIRMASEVIHEARDGFDPVLSRSAELLQNQLDRFESLLGDLLEISRFDAGAAVLETEPVDVREVVARVVDGLAPLAESRSTLVRVHVPALPCIAEIDYRRVERIVRNLVANAVEHGEGNPVDVTVAGDAHAIAVAVLDRGVGLRANEVGRVFDRFWRADPARARSTGGTGLGLAIALEDAHLHAGRLQVWGQPGVGTNFVLTLPRQAGSALPSSPLPVVPYGDGVSDHGPAVTADGAPAGATVGGG